MPALTVGRARELGWIRRRIGEAARAPVLVIEGEAGTGKSHLVDAATEEAPRWWIAFPHPRAGEPAGGLRLLAEASNDDRLKELLEAGDEGDAAKRRRAIFAAATELVSARAPRVVVLDDAHWADGLTLDWLSRSGPGLDRSSTILLIAVRKDSPYSPAVERALAPLETVGLVDRLTLDPLNARAVKTLAAALGFRTDQEEALELAERSGGNPLLVKELCLRRQRRHAVDTTESRPYTRSFSQVVGEQLAEMGASAKEVIFASALAPQPAPEAIVAAASHLESARLESAVAEAVSSGLLVDTTAGSLAFRHDLYRESIEEHLPVSHRRRIHRRVAAALKASPDAPPLQVARQLVGASRLSEAVEWLKRAGEDAARYHDHSGAIEILAEALAYCSPRNGDLAGALIEQLVRAGRLAARPIRALEALDSLQARFAEGSGGGHVFLAIARLRSYQDDYKGRTEALLQAERAFTRWENLRGRALVLAELTFPAGRVLAFEERIRYGRQGLAHAEKLDDNFAWSYCAANMGYSRAQAGDASALDSLEAARHRLDTSVQRHRTEFLRQCVNLVIYQFWFGEYEGSGTLTREARAVADEPFWVSLIGFVEGLVDWRTGRWDDALPRLDAVSRDGSPSFCRIGDAIRLTIRFERGESIPVRELEQVVAELDQKEEDLWTPLAIALCTRVRAWRREPNPTRGVLRQADLIRRMKLRGGWQDLLPTIASVDVPLYERVSGLLGELMPPGRHTEACRLLAEGIRREPDRTAQAVDILEGAAVAFEGIGDPYYEAKAQEALSRTATSHSEARSAAQRAAELYSSLGAARSLARLVRGSRKRGLLSRHPIPASQRGKGAPGLTEREQEVAELAGRGFTVAETAHELMISEGTVRKHLEHIRAKLGISRKTELVRLMHE